MVIATHNPPLEQRPEALNAVGMEIADGIEPLVVDSFVGDQGIQVAIDAGLVSIDCRDLLPLDLAQYPGEGAFPRDGLHHLGADLSGAVFGSDYRGDALAAGTPLGLLAPRNALALHVSFVNLDDAPQAG